MSKKQEKIFVLVAAAIVVAVFIFAPWQNSYFGLFVDTVREPNWDDLNPHDVVKNSVSMTLIEKMDNNCKMSAENLGNVIEHKYFVRGQEFAQAVKFDTKNETVVLPCEMVDGEKSRLHVWYTIEEAPRFGGKYKYFVTPWNDTIP